MALLLISLVIERIIKNYFSNIYVIKAVPRRYGFHKISLLLTFSPYMYLWLMSLKLADTLV